MQVRAAHIADLSHIKALLSQADLPYQDIEHHVQNFQVVASGPELIAAGGLEIYEKVGLLRSLVVAPECRNSGLGRTLYSALLDQARHHKIKSLYLLTESAQDYFRSLGFTDAERLSAPPPIRNTAQFSNLCPESACFMTLSLEEQL